MISEGFLNQYFLLILKHSDKLINFWNTTLSYNDPYYWIGNKL